MASRKFLSGGLDSEFFFFRYLVARSINDY